MTDSWPADQIERRRVDKLGKCLNWRSKGDSNCEPLYDALVDFSPFEIRGDAERRWAETGVESYEQEDQLSLAPTSEAHCADGGGIRPR